jgi:hypothetical protein
MGSTFSSRRELAIYGERGRATHRVENFEHEWVGIIILIVREHDQSEAVIQKDDILGVEPANLSSMPYELAIVVGAESQSETV